MNNLKKYDDYVNEELFGGIKRWASKTFKPGEVGDIVKDIFRKIQDTFDISKLSEAYGGGERGAHFFVYIIQDEHESSRTHIEKLQVGDHDVLLINDDNLTDYVNPLLVRDIYNFLEKKWKNKNREQSNKIHIDKINNLRGKYSKYTH